MSVAAPALEPDADRRRLRRPRHRRAPDDIGPAIGEGEPFRDDFVKTEAKWSKLMAGKRFEDYDPKR